MLLALSAPKLAQSKSLGLQAKDWGYPLREGKRLLPAEEGALLGLHPRWIGGQWKWLGKALPV